MTRRRWLLPVAALLALAAVLVGWQPARVAVQAVLLLPDVFPSAPVDPLSQFTPAPAEAEFSLPYPAGTISARVFHPPSSTRRGGVLLLLGVGDLPRDDLAVRFARALARTGVVVVLPESTGLLNEQLSSVEVDGVVQAYNLLLGQPDVDPARTGMIGLSAAGGLAIVAAARPALRDRVRLVTSLGGYYDARSLLVDAASRSIDVDGQVQPWEPQQRTLEVIRNALIDAGSQDVEDLLAGLDRADVQRRVEALPPPVQARLAEISPSAVLSDVHAHVYVLHDTDDSFIPFTQTRDLVRAAPPGLIRRHTEFSIFAHVIPDRPVPWQTFVPDVWKLYWDIHAVLMELL